MKKLRLVTITGVDNFVNLEEIEKLSKEFPFVEWGILFSFNHVNTNLEPRYPSYNTFHHFNNLPVRKSLHYCGRIVKNILEQDKISSVLTYHQSFLSTISRIQFNVSHLLTRELRTSYTLFDKVNTCKNRGYLGQTPLDLKSIIIQHSGRPGTLLNKPGELNNIYTRYHEDLSIIPTVWPIDLRPIFITGLQDRSGGTGTEYKFLTPTNKYDFCGFAGGINPENIEDKIEEILKLDFDANFWIDMESGVRTNDKLDLEKVYEVLKKASKYYERS